MIIVQHDPRVPLGRFARWWSHYRIVRPYLGEPTPRTSGEPLVILGGSMAAIDDHRAPWLPAVRDLAAQAVADSVPTLGICLGAQLLTVATGGRLSVSDPAGLELGPTRIWATDEGRDDPLIGALGRTWYALSSHRDGIRALPATGTLLATSARYPQAIRVGECAWGVQFHPEVTAESFDEWAREDLSDQPGASPGDLARIRAATAERWEEMSDASRILAHTFARLASSGS